MNKNFLVFLTLIGGIYLFFSSAVIAGMILNVDVRHRPPEMLTDDVNNPSGPLIDIVQEMARKNGYTVKLNKRQFKGSLEKLKIKQIDILPRTICTEKRAAYIDYLGPIGYQKKDILFIVEPGKEATVQNFDDLKKYRVGTKRGTYYFKKFNESKEIEKVESMDDINLVKMFLANRFDVIAVLDRNAIENVAKCENITDYAYAEYKYANRIGNYFGIAKGHPDKELFQRTLEEMVLSGRVKQIYEKHGVKPPAFEASFGFDECFNEE